MEDLYDRIRAAANSAEFFAIDAHGWLNESDEDPEFLGHAMWQTQQPSLLEPCGTPPTSIDVDLIAAGEDFYGLMEAARIAAGLAVIRQPHVENHPFDNDNLFWSQTLQAVVALGTATDRLREFARIGFRGGWPKKGGGRWEEPFSAAPELVSGAPTYVLEAGARLQSMGSVLHERRMVRHEAVHELATKVARGTRDLAEQLRAQNLQELKVDQLSADALKRRYEESQEAAVREHRVALEEIKEWYQLLAKVSSDTFIVEHWIRRESLYASGN